MQRLHVVGFTTDHEALILSARRNAKSGGYMVLADADLEEALTELRRARGDDGDDDGHRAPRPESTLSVREMQQRLRAGQSITEVADVAGVAEEWIARFAIPIQAEQALVIQRALELVATKQRVGPSTQPLGTSVWWNLQDRGAKVSEDEWSEGWSAFLKSDQVWVVRFSYTFRKKLQVGEWEVDLRAGSLQSRNRLGTDLGYVEPGRRRRPGPPKPIPGGLVSRPAPGPAVDAGDEDLPAPRPRRAGKTAKSPAKNRARATKSPTRKSAVKKSPAKKSPAKKSPGTKAAAKKAPAKKAPAKRSAAQKSAAKKSAAKKAPAKRSAAKKSPRKKTAAKRPAAKKARPAPSSNASVLIPSQPEQPRVLVPSPTNSARSTPLIAGAARAGATHTGPLPAARPVPSAAPAAVRQRPVGDDGRPLRREEPLRAR